MLFAIILLLFFMILAVAAVLWGHDSRDNAHTMKLSTHTNTHTFHAAI